MTYGNSDRIKDPWQLHMAYMYTHIQCMVKRNSVARQHQLKHILLCPHPQRASSSCNIEEDNSPHPET